MTTTTTGLTDRQAAALYADIANQAFAEARRRHTIAASIEPDRARWVTFAEAWATRERQNWERSADEAYQMGVQAQEIADSYRAMVDAGDAA